MFIWLSQFKDFSRRGVTIREGALNRRNTVYQLYHGDSSHVHVIPEFHQYYAGALKSLVPGQSHVKTKGSFATRTCGKPVMSDTPYH